MVAPFRPDTLDIAIKSLQKTLPKATAHVGSGFYKSGWIITVYTDDKDIQLPKVFDGFPVEKRGMPKAC